MTSASTFLRMACLLVLLSGTAYAQPISALPLVTHLDGAGIDPEALRAALAVELGLPVERVESAEHAHLAIEGSQLSALRVAFTRDDGSTLERTLDAASLPDQAVEAVALLAANMIRDEASELLATLRAQNGAPVPPAPSPAPPPPAPLALKLPAPEPPLPGGCDRRPQLRTVPAGVDVVPLLGTNGADSGRVERKLSFGLFGDYTGAVHGLELAALFTLNRFGTCGVQLSGIANVSGGPTQGAQLGVIDWTGGRLDGAQFGLLDIATRRVHGIQMGLVDIDGGRLEGAQFALVNVAAGSVKGLQAGLTNLSGDELHGEQLGLVNVASGDLRGLQLGLTNVVAGSVDGAQLGLVNVSSGEVHGAQIGLVNVAEQNSASIGLLNVVSHGETHLDVWGTDAGLGMIGLEHGGRYTYNIYGVGASERDQRFVLASALGLGVHVFKSPLLFVNLDVVGYGMYVHDKAQKQFDLGNIIQLRVPVGLQLIRGVSVFVAPAFNVSITDATNNLLADPSIIGSTRVTSVGSKVAVRIWPGFSAGLRFF